METIVENGEIDYASAEAQLTLLEFYDRLERCYLCEKSWFYKYSLNAWYPQFLAFVDSGLCSEVPDGLNGFEKVVPPDKFYPCLYEALELVDEEKAKQLRWSDEKDGEKRIIGFKTKIHAHRVADASKDGIAYLTDIRAIEAENSFEGTFSYAIIFLDFEMWYTFTSELTLCLSLSIVVILCIILIVTANFYITIMVALCVGITDMFLFALIYYWNLALNPIVLMHVVVSIGISVDYSAHIAYAYLVEPVPESAGCDTNTKIRVYKAKMALRRMGSSVFHGGFSTFIAIFVLAPGTTYIFQAFFRLWFGIILFGMMNGFLFLPVVLSFIGPTKSIVDPAQVHDPLGDKEIDDDGRSVSSMRTTTTAGTNRGSDEGLFSIRERKRIAKSKSCDVKEVVDAEPATEPPSASKALPGKQQSVELADVDHIKMQWVEDKGNAINEDD